METFIGKERKKKMKMKMNKKLKRKKKRKGKLLLTQLMRKTLKMIQLYKIQMNQAAKKRNIGLGKKMKKASQFIFTL